MIVSWLTTNRCNLSCSHCYQDAGESYATELSTTEAERLIEQIAQAGFKIMIFSGGEALLREDIFHLVAHAAKQGLRPVFGTNGTKLTLDVAKQAKAAGAQAMGISLDSLDPEKHSKFRGMAEAYDLTIQGMRNCREIGLPFQVHTTVLDWNRDELLAITDFCVEMGARAHYVFFLVPVGRGIYLEENALEVVNYEKTLRALMEKQKQVPIEIKPTCAPQFMRVAHDLGLNPRFSRGCLAGLTYCIITPDGMVRPCAYMTEYAGNVREQSFADIWRDAPIFKTLRTKAYKGACAACPENDSCGGCRARAAYYHNGDLLAEDSYCIRSHNRKKVLE